MASYKILIVAAIAISLMFTSAYAEEKTESSPSINAKPQQAHDFFAYLIKLGVLEIDVEKDCYDGVVIPETITYTQGTCESTFSVSYSCKDGKETHTSESHIDWRYISEMEKSGYSHDNREIEIAGNITTKQTAAAPYERARNKKSNTAKKIRFLFDSPATAKRALNAFTLLKNKCDTSADYPF